MLLLNTDTNYNYRWLFGTLVSFIQLQLLFFSSFFLLIDFFDYF